MNELPYLIIIIYLFHVPYENSKLIIMKRFKKRTSISGMTLVMLTLLLSFMFRYLKLAPIQGA